MADRYLSSTEDARDAVQEAFVAAFRAIDTFEGSSKLSTWLHKIVVNSCLMKLRTRHRKPEDPVDELLPRWLEDGHHEATPLDWVAMCDGTLKREEERCIVRQCIAQLPEEYRRAPSA